MLLLLIAVCSHNADAAAETLTVKVSGFKGSAGNVQVMVWKDAAGFPMKPEKAVAQKSVPVAGRSVEVVFDALPPGQYGVAGFQDLNGNGKLDRSLLGWPVEPVGASNGATGMVGPPQVRRRGLPAQGAAAEHRVAAQIAQPHPPPVRPIEGGGTFWRKITAHQ